LLAMKKQILIIVIAMCLITVSYTQADYSEEGLEVQCDQWQMRVRDFDFTDDSPGQRQHVGTVIYRDHKHHKVNCLINKHKVSVDFQLIGGIKCGIGSLVTLRIDDQLIIKDAQIHGCPVGVTEIGVIPGLDSEGGYEVEFCGYTSVDQMPAFHGCVKVTAKQLASIKKPLNPIFPVGALIKLVKFPS
jgi:hypothetical protein